MINSYQCSSLTYIPQYEPVIVKKFKRISQIPIQIWLSKNDNIQIYKNARMLQDLNPKHMQVHVACSSLVIFIYWACERQGSKYHAVRLG